MTAGDDSRADNPDGWNRSVLGPNGSDYRIRAVRKGEPLRDEGSAASDLGDIVFELAIDGARAAIRSVRRKRGALSGYTVGVIRKGKARDKVIRQVLVAEESGVAATLDELERDVRAGTVA